MKMQFEIIGTCKKEEVSLSPRTHYKELFAPLLKSIQTLDKSEVLLVKMRSSYTVTKFRECIKREIKYSKFRVLSRKTGATGAQYNVYIYREDGE